MKHRIQIGALRRSHPRPPPIIHPVFPPACVCCNAATERTVAWDFVHTRLADAFMVPVCDACTDHAAGRTRVSFASLALTVGGSMLGAAAVSADWSAPLFDGACGMWAAAFAIHRIRAARGRARVPAGHHADCAIAIAGVTIIETSNATLAEELLARNPDARRTRGEAVPSARLVR